ncbi:MAG: tRNA guanosine(34) transglycosylase Tgt [Gammaproteobacteria bacterium]|nr:tRNA guanosine(34) transglycosylase Tgt [Gammaproteobacteria bacterium]
MSKSAALEYELIAKDPNSHARLGRVTTEHGSFDTPAFMPVGTQGTVKGVMPDDLSGLGAQIILGNTYHLMLRPGSELIAKMGGLQKWTTWGKPMLTDSGGFQVFSLSDTNKITEEGVVFKSHINGARIDLTPERSMEVQNQLGADIIMAFDDCPPAAVRQDDGAGAEGLARHAIAQEEYAKRLKIACERSNRWLARCNKAHARKSEQSLFGIIQGGTDLEQRKWCVDEVCGIDLPGYAIGGVAVGEGFEQLKRVVEYTAPLMPTDKPRYLMGVGYERDILTAVKAGIDMFDCVLPTRNARNTNAFTPTGQIKLRNAKFADDPRPIDEGCDCQACSRGYSRSYLRHLFNAGEMLGPILVTLHNLRHFQRFLLDIRTAIRDNDWSIVSAKWPVAML